MCTSIIKINIKHNDVEEEDNISYLSSLVRLKWLNMKFNPVTMNDNYKNLIQKYLPQIEHLDEDENCEN
jgi:hypothetical protein